MNQEQFDEFIRNACGAAGVMTRYLDADDRDVDAELSKAPAAKLKMAIGGDWDEFKNYFSKMESASKGTGEVSSTSC